MGVNQPCVELITQKLVSQIQPLGLTAKQTLWVAYSGGVDSTVLLDATFLACEKMGIKNSPVLKAVHVNHQLSSDAQSWQVHCQAQCDAREIDLHILTVNPETPSEDAARQARYQALSQLIQNRDVLMLGHHQQDQVETVLFRLLRGTGPTGLMGMAKESELLGMQVLRPLLDVQKNDIDAYARERQLSWVEDSSNLFEGYDRNYLRLQIFPKLSLRWPKVSVAIAALSGRQRAESQTLDWLLRNQLADFENDKNQLNINKLYVIPRHARCALLRFWLWKHKQVRLDAKHIEEIDKQFFTTPYNKPKACFIKGRIHLVCEQGWIMLLER